jgi:hypothetical protein
MPDHDQSQPSKVDNRFGPKEIGVIALTCGVGLGAAMGLASQAIYSALVGGAAGVGLVLVCALISQGEDRQGKRFSLIGRDIRAGSPVELTHDRGESGRTEHSQAFKTIVGQIVTATISLALGGALLWVLARWANTWGLTYSDNSRHDFLLGPYASSG